jgi:hypothetical protein
VLAVEACGEDAGRGQDDPSTRVLTVERDVPIAHRAEVDAGDDVRCGDQQQRIFALEQTEQMRLAVAQIDHALHVVRGRLQDREIAYRGEHRGSAAQRADRGRSLGPGREHAVEVGREQTTDESGTRDEQDQVLRSQVREPPSGLAARASLTLRLYYRSSLRCELP